MQLASELSSSAAQLSLTAACEARIRTSLLIVANADVAGKPLAVSCETSSRTICAQFGADSVSLTKTGNAVAVPALGIAKVDEKVTKFDAGLTTKLLGTKTAYGRVTSVDAIASSGSDVAKTAVLRVVPFEAVTFVARNVRRQDGASCASVTPTIVMDVIRTARLNATTTERVLLLKV
jgi:hypothetical protein